MPNSEFPSFSDLSDDELAELDDSTGPLAPAIDPEDPSTALHPLPAGLADQFLPHLRALELLPGHSYCFFVPDDQFDRLASLLASFPPGALPWSGIILPARFAPGPGDEPQLQLQAGSLEEFYRWLMAKVSAGVEGKDSE
jgi:hypothetical protein